MIGAGTDRLSSARSRRRELGVCSRSLAAVFVGVLALAAQPASAATVRVKPSSVARHALVFELEGIKPETIVRGRLSTHRGSTRVRVATLRRAARRGRLRLTRGSRWSRRVRIGTLRRSRLVITYVTSRPPAASAQSWRCGWGSFGVDSMPGACWRPFGDGSFVNRPLPRNPRLVSNSRAMVARMLSFGEMKPIWPNPQPGLDYQHPYFFSRSSDPLYTVNSSRPDAPDGVRVRIPSYARPAGAEDSHLAVLDQQTGYEYSFFAFPKSRPADGGTISAALVQRAKIDGNGGGDEVDVQGYSTAAAAGLMAGVVRFPELAAGRIDHAIFLVTGDTNGKQVFPARSYGPACDRSDCPPTGQWLMLDMSDAQIAALPVADWQKTIFRALARYGGWIGDQGGATALWMQAEGPTTWQGTNPWLAWAEQQRARPNSHIDTYEADGERRYRLEVFDAPIDWKSKLKAVHPCVIKQTC